MHALAQISHIARLCVGAFRSLENIEYNMCRAARVLFTRELCI